MMQMCVCIYFYYDYDYTKKHVRIFVYYFNMFIFISCAFSVFFQPFYASHSNISNLVSARKSTFRKSGLVQGFAAAGSAVNKVNISILPLNKYPWVTRGLGILSFRLY